MASRVAVAVLLGVLLASPLIATATLDAQYPPLNASKTFDFYYLVLMWPGAYCEQSVCCRPTTGLPQKDFLIRGLWTYDSTTGKPVTKCNKTPFNANELWTISQDLHDYWSSLRCPNNNGALYWKKTWKTYGVSSGMEQSDYFKATLDLRAKVDLLSHLSNKDVVPNEFELYNVADIERAIAEGIGAAPVIRCSQGRFQEMQLYEVYVCIDKDAKKVIECPVKSRFTCPSTVRFLPFEYEDLLGSVAADAIKMPVSDE